MTMAQGHFHFAEQTNALPSFVSLLRARSLKLSPAVSPFVPESCRPKRIKALSMDGANSHDDYRMPDEIKRTKNVP
jgi:hypothetical protein